MKLNYKILIIDDNVIDQIVTKQLLKKKLNLQAIEVVNNGKEGLQWLLDYDKDSTDLLLILLDIKMPEMDGFEFLEEFERLKSNLISIDFMIVMLSSSLDPKDKKRADNNLNVTALLSKPLQTEELSLLLVDPEYK